MDKHMTEEKLVKVLRNPNVSKTHKERAKRWLKKIGKYKQSYNKYISMTPQELYKLKEKEL